MIRPRKLLLQALCIVCGAQALSARGADDDALALPGPSEPEQKKESPWRVTLEGGIGSIDRRLGLPAQDARRAALDVRYSGKLSESWRLTLSDRLDSLHPVADGRPSTRNDLREAYAAWQITGENTAIELGRLNLRHGNAFGYNPTDVFRSGAVRTVTTADPLALRENRLGTFMARVSQLGANGGFAVALAPKLANGPDSRAVAVDAGATNSAHRALLTVDVRSSDRLSSQALLLLERGKAATLGASFTALVSNSAVAYGELTSSKSPSLHDQIVGSAGAPARKPRAALGLTYTLPSSMAVTVEAEFNGAGLDRSGWTRVFNQGPLAYQRFVALTQPNLELGSRHALLVYATQKDLGIKRLDLTAFVRKSTVDHSALAWAEVRYHWPQFDLALQWQRSFGAARTEFGAMPQSQIVQLAGYFYF